MIPAGVETSPLSVVAHVFGRIKEEALDKEGAVKVKQEILDNL